MLPRSLAPHTGGVLELHVEARNVRGLIAAVDRILPGIGELLDGAMAVAIDGEIHGDPMLEPVDADSEVHFLPRVGGGS